MEVTSERRWLRLPVRNWAQWLTSAISQLPLNSRDTYQLLSLQPGVQSQTGTDPVLEAIDQALCR